ncbi:hypothetical protein D623_10003235 [Myotis brandtii]|uniref:Uncharacterized protein n=1 Tax=Myotis brandtii TaxID=109478 RepID=S7P5F2_MYOBR|nr:hypothetical protein D623_10003235 [Myotis brandtii]
MQRTANTWQRRKRRLLRYTALPSSRHKVQAIPMRMSPRHFRFRTWNSESARQQESARATAAFCLNDIEDVTRSE